MQALDLDQSAADVRCLVGDATDAIEHAGPRARRGAENHDQGRARHPQRRVAEREHQTAPEAEERGHRRPPPQVAYR